MSDKIESLERDVSLLKQQLSNAESQIAYLTKELGNLNSTLLDVETLRTYVFATWYTTDIHLNNDELIKEIYHLAEGKFSFDRIKSMIHLWRKKYIE